MGKDQNKKNWFADKFLSLNTFSITVKEQNSKLSKLLK